MKSKKGFTLVELLAIIVILAVIMVIAVPKILDVVNGSKSSAWKDNVGMIKKAIVTNSQLIDVETGTYKYSIDKLCSDPSKVKEVVKLEDTTVTCSGNVFTLTGTGQFVGKSATITCTNNKCTVTIKQDSNSSLAGLYDASGKQLATWDELVNEYGLDFNWGKKIDKNRCFDTESNYNSDLSEEDKQKMGITKPGYYCASYVERTAGSGDSNYCATVTQEMLNESPEDFAGYGITKPGYYCMVFEPVATPAQVFDNSKLKTGSKIVFPETINYISAYAFYGVKNLTSFAFNGNVKFGEHAFDGTGIKDITFSENVNEVELEEDAFLDYDEGSLEMVFFDNPFGWKMIVGNESESIFPHFVYSGLRMAYLFGINKSFKLQRDTSVTKMPSTDAGLYDASNNLIVSWYDLVNVYGLDMEWASDYPKDSEFGACLYLKGEPSFNLTVNFSTEGWYCYKGGGYKLFDLDDIVSAQPAIAIAKADRENKGVKLVVSNTVDNLGIVDDFYDGSFVSLKNVSEIILPNTINVIGMQMFSLCDKLERVSLTEGVTHISAYAFSESLNLKKITIPNSVVAIFESAFGRLPSSTQIEFSDPNGWSVKRDDESEKISISAADLSDKDKAKQYLTKDYLEYTWTKE